MEFTQSEQLGIWVIKPCGRIDSITANDLEATLLDALRQEKYTMVLDLSAVDFISSAGLRILLMIAKKAKPHHGQLVLCHMNKDVMEVFDISGFSSIFTIKSSVDEAIDSLKNE